MKSLPVSQAREHLADVIAGLADGPVEITRHGVALAYMVSPAMFDKLTSHPPDYTLATEVAIPATGSLEELVAIELGPPGDGPALSDILHELREDVV